MILRNWRLTYISEIIEDDTDHEESKQANFELLSCWLAGRD
jgi:hypothetical protein